MSGTKDFSKTRRDLLQAAATAGAATAIFGSMGINPALAAEAVGRSEKPLKAAFCNAMGGKGKIIMTQGALGHTGAQGRAKGFNAVVKQFPNIEVLDTQPADWDVSKTARLWETYLTKYPQIDAAFFHNDDMALAAYNIMKARNRTNILIGGVDAMPPAISAVSEGRMFATVRNPSCRIHGGAIVAGVAAVNGGEKSGQGIPKHVITDGPVVTKANAAGMQWMEDHFLI